MKKTFWALTLSVPIAAIMLGIALVGYWTIPALPLTMEGDPVLAFDPEIGFVPFRQGKSKRSHLGLQGPLEYNLYTDQRGARVSKPGEQTADRVSVLFVGDSFTWGHGVEAENTFAYGVAKRLDVAVANLALGSYGTTHSLQMLRRNGDLAPRVIVYSFIDPQLQRNLAPCAASYYPFCLDQSHVTWKNGKAVIAPPFSNGVRRSQLHVEAQQRGLWPPTWIVHGLDVVFGKILLEMGGDVTSDGEKQKAALEFLLGEMSATAKSLSAELLIVYVPLAQMTPPPVALLESVANLNLEFLDLFPTFQGHRGAPAYIPNDGHPSVEGHARIAEEITSAIRTRRLLN